jgi:TP901 family phage tail tape measure protein
VATRSLGELRAELVLESRYDATGAKAFQADILRMQSQTQNVEANLGDIARRVRELQTAGQAVDILPDLDREAMDMVLVLNRMADDYGRKLQELAGRQVISPDQFQRVQAFTADIRQLADGIDLLEAHGRTEDGGYRWNPSGQARRLAESFQGSIGDTNKFLSTLTHAYVELDRIHTRHFERMSQRSLAAAKEQEQLSRIMGRGEGFAMTISAVSRLTDNLGRLELGLQNAAVDYARLQREIAVASSDAPDALSPDRIRAASAAVVDALKLQKTKIRELLADPGLDKLFDGEVLRESLSNAVQSIDRQITALKGSLDLVPTISFLGRDFAGTVEVIQAGARKGGRVLEEFAAATAQSAKVVDGAFETVEQAAVEASKSLRHLPGLEGIFEINSLNNAGAKFSQTLNALVRLRTEFNRMQADFKDQAFGSLYADDTSGFVSRFKELQVGITATGALLRELHTNPSLAALFPPDAVDVIRRMQREVDKLNSRVNNPQRQKAGTFLGSGLNESAYIGAVGAVRTGIGQVEIALQGAGQEAATLSVNMDNALQMMESGRILNSVKAFRSLNLAMQAVDQGAKAAAAGLPAILDKLALFNDKQLAEMANPKNQFTGEDAFERYQKRFTKNYGATLALIKDYQTEMAGLDAALKRYIDTGEQFGIVTVEDLARAREYRALIASLKDATPAELAALDAAAVAKQSRDTLGANQQHLRDNAAQLKAANTELVNNLQLVRGLAEASAYLDDGPQKAAESYRELSASGSQTAEIIERLREKAHAQAQAIEEGEAAMGNLAQAAHKAGAAGADAAEAQAKLAATTTTAGAAATGLGEDISLVNARLRETETAVGATGVAFRDGAGEADRLAQEFIDMGRAAGGMGGDLNALGGQLRDLGEPIRVTEVRFDELLDHLKRDTAFKELNERFETSARRIIEEQTAIGQLTATYGRYIREQARAGAGGDRFERALKGVGATVLALNGDLQQADAAMAKYAQAWREISGRQTLFSRGSSLIQSLFPAGDETRLAGLRDRLLGVTDRLHDWRTEMKLIRAGVAETESTVYKAMGVLGKLKSNIVEGLFHGVGYELTNALQMAAMAVKQFIKDSTQAHMDFGRGVAEIYTIIPDASHYMRQRIADDIETIASSFGYLQNEVLPATYQALSLGVPAPAVTDAVATAAMAARASVSDLAPTLETGQALVNAYGGEVYHLTEIYDLLFYAIKNGSITMRDINNQMAPITAVAGEVGVAFEDIVAAMVVMSRQGDDMGTISRMLTNMLTQIQIETTALGKAFKDAAGVGFREFIAAGGTLVEAMALISDSVQKTGVSITESVGGDSPFYRDQQAMLAVLELTGRHLEDLERAADGASRAGGGMAAAYREVENTLWLMDRRAAAATENMQRDLGAALEPLSRSWLELRLFLAEGLSRPLERSAMFDMVRQIGAEAGRSKAEVQQLIDSIEFLRTAKEQTTFWEAFAGQFEGGGAVALVDAFRNAWDQSRAVARSAEEQTFRNRVAYMALAGSVDFTAEEIIALSDELRRAVVLQHLLSGGRQGEVERIQAQIAKEQELARIKAAILEEEFGIKPDGLAWTGGRTFAPRLEEDLVLVDQFGNELDKIGEKVKALDGDTFDMVLNGNVTKVRLSGIDTAEIAHEDGGQNMAYGRAALDFAQDFLIRAGGRVVVSDSVGESYERQLRQIFTERGLSLERELLKAGLAVPVSLELAVDEAQWREQQALALRAAREGAGVFQNDLVQSLFLEGSISDMAGISRVYESITGHFEQTIDFTRRLEEALAALQAADGAWVEGHVDNAARIAAIQAQLAGDLTKEQRSALDARLKELDAFTAEYDAIAAQIGRDLTENRRGDLLAELAALEAGQGTPAQVFSGNAEEADKARESVALLREEIERYFKTLTFESFMASRGGITREVVELGVALGIFSRDAGESALRMAEIATALERLAAGSEFAGLSVQQQAGAVELLMSGWVTTADEAIGKLMALQAERDRIIASFVSGGGTQVYWDMAAGDTAAAPSYEIQIDAALSPAYTATMSGVTTQLQALKDAKYEVTLGILPDAFNDTYDILSGKIAEYETATPTLFFDTEHVAAESVMDRLLEKAKDRTVTYTYNVKVNGREPSVEGGQAGGGYIYPGTWLVGEQGPELITMAGYGTVTNNADLRRALAGGGNSLPPIVVNIDARGVQPRDLYWLEHHAERGIVRALRSGGYKRF